MGVTLILLAFLVTMTLAAQQCQILQITSLKVTLTTSENDNGHVNTKVVINQGGGNGVVWVGGVNQNIVRCDTNDPEIETTIVLQANPSAGAPTVPDHKCPSTGVPTVPDHKCPSTGVPTVPDHKCPSTGVTTVPVRKTPPENYELFSGVGYYKYHGEKLFWPQARNVCDAEGGHLIILNSEEENGVAKRIFARHPNGGTWFHAGFLEMGTHLQYFTIFGERLERTGYFTILPGENNDPGVHDLGVVNRNGGYADIPPAHRLSFICEFDL